MRAIYRLTCSPVLVKLICNQILIYVVPSHIIPDHQHGATQELNKQACR